MSYSDIMKQFVRERQTEGRLRKLDMADIVAEVHDLEDRWAAAEAQLAAERESLREDAERYRWIRDKYEWRRHGNLPEEDSYAFVGCRFPYLANFECKAMLDYNIDQMREALADTQEMTLDDHTRKTFGEEDAC